jgi:GH15 family glucan-1,4-alpha-glucosidase
VPQSQRSFITLKAITYRPTGGVVAAITTSLPESIGGTRNWDYRFCWLRDTTFTLLALTTAGYYDEAEAWQDWLLRAIGRQSRSGPDHVRPQGRAPACRMGSRTGFQVMRIRSPVRIGNAAAMQVQLDIYGEVLDCFYPGTPCICAAPLKTGFARHALA